MPTIELLAQIESQKARIRDLEAERDAEAMAADWFGERFRSWYLQAKELFEQWGLSEMLLDKADARAERLEKAMRELVAEIGPCTCGDDWKAYAGSGHYDPTCTYHAVGGEFVGAAKEALGWEAR